jgi:glutamate---cysteine ligase / carboxylate-amine ligase
VDELNFKSSPGLTLGVELELQLVRPRDLDLSRDAADLLARLEKRKLPGAVKPEITESMLELNTSVHERHADLLAELVVMRNAVVGEAGVLNLRVCGGGAHPFHEWSERRIFPTERFKYVLERYGYLAKQFTVFGQHIHVGCESGDAAVYLVHMLTRYVPHFIALSAASPFYQGEDTSFQSSRLTAVSAFPLAGHMPFVLDWAEFLEYFARMKGYGVVSSMKDFYWDIRPKPEYGTVEVRVCDTPLTVRRAALLAAYAQTLAAYHLSERRREPARAVYLVNSHNRFEACRYGLRGEMVDVYDNRKRRIGEDILASIETVKQHGERLGCAEALLELAAAVRDNDTDAAWLRERYRARGALADVVRDSAARWAAEEPKENR